MRKFVKRKESKKLSSCTIGKLYIIYFIQPNMLDEYSKELFNNVKLKEQYLELEFAFGVFCYVNKTMIRLGSIYLILSKLKNIEQYLCSI